MLPKRDAHGVPTARELVLNELIMKKLALFGCTCLLVAHSVKDKVNVNAYAGLLFEDDDNKKKMAGRRKSAALLASRRGGAKWKPIASPSVARRKHPTGFNT